MRRLDSFLPMVQITSLVIRFRGQIHTKTAEYAYINLRENHAGMDFTMTKFRKLFKGDFILRFKFEFNMDRPPSQVYPYDTINDNLSIVN